MADEDEDFEFQLRQQQLQSQTVGQQPEEEQSGTTYTDPNDGTVYEWDHEKRAWFPKIDDDFIAMYQASYGVSEPSTSAGADDGIVPKEGDGDEGDRKGEGTGNQGDGDNGSNDKGGTGEGAREPSQESENSRKRKMEDGWFELDESKNTNVYVTGLPHDITEEEYVELMSKYGIIKEDDNGELKLKLYRDQSGELKGDGRCCYLKRESVDLAIQLLNDSDYRGYRVYVELAHFEQKGQYQPGMKKKKPMKKQKKITKQDKLLGWKEAAGPSRSKYDRIVVLEHMFHPKDFENSPASLQEIREDVREECEKFGPVRKIMVFDRHPDGIVSVAFKEFESADICIETMQGRFFAGRRIQAHSWDGVTNYQVEETEEERAKRLKQWENFLEEGSAADDKEDTKQSATA